MANWREIGFVPDSDDEDELDPNILNRPFCEDHNFIGDESHESLSRENNGDTNKVGHEKVQDTVPLNFEPTRLKDLPIDVISKEDGNNYQALDNEVASISSGLTELNELPVTGGHNYSLTQDERQILPLASSPSAPREFKIPNPFWEEVGHRNQDEVRSCTEDTSIRDDISKSYVQISSPASSVLSSPPSSLADVFEYQRPKSNNMDTQNSNSAGTKQNDNTMENAEFRPSQEPIYPMKRALRQRNLIQLHPYIVEQEKYRQTLKARGIAPMRIIQSRENRFHRSRGASTEHDAENEEDTQETGDGKFMTQSTDRDWSPIPSSCPLRTTGTSNNLEESTDTCITTDPFPEDNEDNESLPDMSTLLKQRKCLPLESNPETTERGVKLRKRQECSLNDPSHSFISSQRTTIRNNFSLPVSPLESSPILELTEDPNTLSHVSLLSSFENESSQRTRHVLEENTLTNLITPANSSLRLSIDAITIDSDTDLNQDDPFVSSASEIDLAQSSSDESVQLRKVYKKIRGVLPASHLRLDTQKFLTDSVLAPQEPSTSSAKILPRKGVAIPKARKGDLGESHFFSDGLQFLTDDMVDENDDELGEGFTSSKSVVLESENMPNFEQSGFAEEADFIDAMLPSRKRSSSNKSLRLNKKRSLIIGRTQSRITDHLKRPRDQDKSIGRSAKKPRYDSPKRRPKGLHKYKRSKLPTAAPLSILDVIDFSNEEQSKLPNFVKIATRTARLRKDHSRRTPSKKWIRLATREDTNDVQSVLENWKKGLIVPKLPLKSPTPSNFNLRPVINQAGHLASLDNEFVSKKNKLDSLPHKRRIQQPLDYFAARKDPKMPSSICRLPNLSYSHKKMYNYETLARPAQLESATPYYAYQYPSTFKSSKKKIDTLYSALRKMPATQPSFQLCRFLKEQEAPCSSIEMDTCNIDHNNVVEQSRPLILNSPRRKKRRPQRIDAGAARYRQPSNPLILEILSPKENVSDHDTKLLGLGKFGTRYPVHFDILPLQQGTFFHADTIIGIGLLRNTIQGVTLGYQDGALGNTSLTVGERNFSWGIWDESSASELGICFDFLSEWFLSPRPEINFSTEPKDIILFVLKYAQQNISYDKLLDKNHFLSRMIEVIQEFSSRQNPNLRNCVEHVDEKIEVFSICSLLVLHLLQISRADHEASTFIAQLENLLIKITSQCAEILLKRGLESIRKLYDDLQYQSFREAGISRNNYTIQGWVILIKVINAACIPKGSFWDVTNAQLRLGEVHSISDAAKMEKLWYSIYTILPLCEFDDCGFVVPGCRQSSRFDNWHIIQQLLKRVFSMYKSNQRQSPGFNEYCRTLLCRCHFLMVEWGWWNSSALIGSIFDFFASQNLSHLRNEEVYHSPRFIEELDTVPSLIVEPEDRCFHIFLKIVALRFRNLRQSQDYKGIRNLGARLLPNHDRQYPKEEKIHQRDLASLRNHHDLLCTLFWSMPPDQRPSISLIQELVIFDRSHKEACLINLRSWENLARFIVTTSCDPISFQPFNSWQSAFFTSLHEQYIEAEAEVRKQSEEINHSSGDMMTEGRIAEIILTNRKSIIISMCRSIKAIGTVVKVAASDIMVKQAFNSAVLIKAMDPNLYNTGPLTDSLLKEVIQVLVNYMDQIDKLHPSILFEPTNYNYRNEDSQDSLDMANWGRIEMISLLEFMLNHFHLVVKRRIIAQCHEKSETSIIGRLINCWTRFICTVTENDSKKFQSILQTDSIETFQNRRILKFDQHYWPLFLANLLQYGKSLDDFKFPGFSFDIGLEWLVSLTTLEALSAPEVKLTAQIYQKGHYLCATLDINKFDRAQIIRAAICKMNMLLEGPIEVETGLPKIQAQRHFSEILREVQGSMQQVLESLEPSSRTHIEYLNFARSVITSIKCYASGFRSLSEFFIRPSAHYWPHDADPDLYAAGIVSYCVRLNQQPEKTPFELFYYLYSGWTSALVSNRVEEFKVYIKTGMKQREFTHFMLLEFVPAILEVGFSLNGWILCSTFLPAIAHRLGRLLETIGPESHWASQQFMNILRFVMNGIIKHLSYHPRGVHQEHRGILAVTLQFWMQNAAALRQFIERNPASAGSIKEIINPLSTFIYTSLQSFSRGETSPPCVLTECAATRGRFTARFVADLTREIQECWHFPDATKHSVIVKARSRETSAEQSFGVTLGEVLRGEVATYEVLFEDQSRIYDPSSTGAQLVRHLIL
ncbi:hypothetical protein K3495_g3198 [Podosphaera aphanis]|nr:hypothetical protein K3495_g3198 [Podosphaera aphanis]